MEMGHMKAGLSEEEKTERRRIRLEKQRATKKALNDSLPENWKAWTCKDTGDVYYSHKLTGEVTWVRPVVVQIEQHEVIREIVVEGDNIREEELAATNEEMRDK